MTVLATPGTPALSQPSPQRSAAVPSNPTYTQYQGLSDDNVSMTAKRSPATAPPVSFFVGVSVALRCRHFPDIDDCTGKKCCEPDGCFVVESL